MSASSPDSEAPQAARQRKNFDLDRHTEVGGPPTGQVPKDDGAAIAADARGKSVTTTFTGPARRGIGIAIAAVVVIGGGAGVWRLTRSSTEAIVTPAAGDASLAERLGIFAIDPIPEGRDRNDRRRRRGGS